MNVRNEFSKDRGRIQWKYLQGGTYEHYKVRIALEGTPQELNSVKQVTYVLDPSFPNRRRVSRAKASSFAISIWTYGDFPMTAEVLYNDGSYEVLEHTVELILPADDDEYVRADE